MLLINCGKASKVTKGALSGLFTEAGLGPFNRFDCVPGGLNNPPQCPR